MQGHFKLEQPCANEGDSRLRMKFGAREIGTGEMIDLLHPHASDNKSYLSFSNQGRNVSGEIHSRLGVFNICGGLVQPARDGNVPAHAWKRTDHLWRWCRKIVADH